MGPHLKFRLPKFMRAYTLVFGVLWFGVLGVNIPAVLRSNGFGATPFLLFFGLGGGLFLYRMGSMAVTADGDVLILRNFFRTYRFTRQAVEGFRIGRPSMGMPFGRTIHVLLNDETVVTADVFAYGWAGVTQKGRERLQQRLDALRRWLAAAS